MDDKQQQASKLGSLRVRGISLRTLRSIHYSVLYKSNFKLAESLWTVQNQYHLCISFKLDDTDLAQSVVVDFIVDL
jgi:hypothetical protein